MNNDLEHKLVLLVGMFVIVCLAGTLIYGADMLVFCLVGLLIFAAMLRAIGGGR